MIHTNLEHTQKKWMNYDIRYEFFYRHGSPCYQYIVIGRHGAVHLHFSCYKYGDEPEKKSWSGGVEYHYRTPPPYMDDRPPSHANCPFLNSNCWHDGSSNQATAYLDYFLHGYHDLIFSGLIRDYERAIVQENMEVEE